MAVLPRQINTQGGKMFSLDEQLSVLSDEELNQLEQALLQTSQTQGERIATTASSAALGFGRGAVAALRGEPTPAAPKPAEDLKVFEEKERIKAKIKQEFGGAGGMQIVQLPGGGFAVIPGGKQTAESAATNLSQQTDAQGNPVELEDVTITSGGIKGKVPKTPEQREQEAITGGVKKGVEEAFKQAEGLKRALKKVGSITRQFNEALPDKDRIDLGLPKEAEQRISGFIAVIGAETGLKKNPKLLALKRTAKLQLRAILRDMGEGARLSDQDITQNIALIEQEGLTNEEREALIATYMQTAVDSMDFRTLRVLKEDPSVVNMFDDLGIILDPTSTTDVGKPTSQSTTIGRFQVEVE